MAPSSNDRPAGGKDPVGGDTSGSGARSWTSANGSVATAHGKSSSRTSRTPASTDDPDRTTTISAGPATLTGTSEPPATAAKGSRGGSGRSPRRIRLTLARLDPFSVMKLSFLLSIGIGIATVVAVALLWNIVDSIGLWDTMNSLGKDLTGGSELPIMEFFTFSKMISYATIAAVANIVIITALGTLFAFLYNIVAGLLGGLKMTFTDQ